MAWEKTSKESDSTASEPWNIAKGYVTMKILAILVENDKLVKIALYGCEDVSLSMTIDNPTKIPRFKYEIIKNG